jgi:tRNA(Ile)-lysidine synthase
MPAPPFLESATQRIAELMARACPQVPDPGLLVALSGGPDSVALLLAAVHWGEKHGRRVEAAHLNHRLRGQDADQDAQFCQELCARLEVPLHLKSQDPRPVAQRRGQGLEEAGRHLRLAFFHSLLDEHPHLKAVAKGHHRDDQTETVIMRLFRGTGPVGLSGIRPVAGRIIHPLLGQDRQSILAFLGQVGQPWRTDASNLDGDNTRSRVRRELLPLARDIFGQGCHRTPARLAELLAQDQEYLAEMTGEALAGLREPRGGQQGLQISGLLRLPAAMAGRVLRRWLIETAGADPATLEATHIMNILAWLREGQSGTGLDLTGQVRVVRDFDILRCGLPATGGLPLAGGADYRVLVRRLTGEAQPEELGRREGPGLADDQGRWNLTCPAGVLQGNLKVRNPAAGDRFQPFGLDGTRKLSDLFREQRVPEAHRGRVLLVEDEAGILWVVGLARAERTRLLPTTGSMVTICVARR